MLRPRKELKAFAKVGLDPGADGTVTLVLGHRSFARFTPGDAASEEVRSDLALGSFTGSVEGEPIPPGWTVDEGNYVLHIGRSVADLAWQLTIEVSHAHQRPAPPPGEPVLREGPRDGHG